MPCTTVNDDGDADRAKFGAALTVSVTVVVRCNPPPVPVTVMGYVPGVVLAPTVIVMVDVPDPGAGMVLGLKPIVTPVGAPLDESAIELLKPLLTVEVMVDVF